MEIKIKNCLLIVMLICLNSLSLNYAANLKMKSTLETKQSKICNNATEYEWWWGCYKKEKLGARCTNNFVLGNSCEYPWVCTGTCGCWYNQFFKNGYCYEKLGQGRSCDANKQCITGNCKNGSCYCSNRKYICGKGGRTCIACD
jgi:hypothetical protein